MTTRTKLYWVAILYFAEGFPFGIIKDALPVFFRVHGVRLADIGLLTLVGLPWSLKFLWAPAVDLWGKRRTWILGCQTLLVVGILALLAVDPSHVTAVLWVLLLSLAFLSATQDIAIDAYTIELLDEAGDGACQWPAGDRPTALRSIVGRRHPGGTGRTHRLADGLCRLRPCSWGVLSVLSWRMPHPDQPRASGGMPVRGADALQAAVWTPLRQFFAHPGFISVLCFVLLYKLGRHGARPNGASLLGRSSLLHAANRRGSRERWGSSPRSSARSSAET